jgi:hypothetical protein
MARYLPTGLQSGSGSRLVGCSLHTRLSQGEKHIAMMTHGMMRFHIRTRRLVASASMPAADVASKVRREPTQHSKDDQRERDDALCGDLGPVPHEAGGYTWAGGGNRLNGGADAQ